MAHSIFIESKKLDIYIKNVRNFDLENSCNLQVSVLQVLKLLLHKWTKMNKSKSYTLSDVKMFVLDTLNWNNKDIYQQQNQNLSKITLCK